MKFLSALLAALVFANAANAQTPQKFSNIQLSAPTTQGTAASVNKLFGLTTTGVGEAMTPTTLWRAVVLSGDVDAADITGLGAAATLATSTGGNGNPDSGKVLIFDSHGGITTAVAGANTAARFTASALNGTALELIAGDSGAAPLRITNFLPATASLYFSGGSNVTLNLPTVSGNLIAAEGTSLGDGGAADTGKVPLFSATGQLLTAGVRLLEGNGEGHGALLLGGNDSGLTTVTFPSGDGSEDVAYQAWVTDDFLPLTGGNLTSLLSLGVSNDTAGALQFNDGISAFTATISLDGLTDNRGWTLPDDDSGNLYFASRGWVTTAASSAGGLTGDAGKLVRFDAGNGVTAKELKVIADLDQTDGTILDTGNDSGTNRLHLPSGDNENLATYEGLSSLYQPLDSDLTSLATNGPAYDRPENHGGVANDATSDKTALQDTFNAVAAAGGGTAFIPRGVWLVDPGQTGIGLLARTGVKILCEDGAIIRGVSANAGTDNSTHWYELIAPYGYNTATVEFGAEQIWMVGGKWEMDAYAYSTTTNRNQHGLLGIVHCPWARIENVTFGSVCYHQIEINQSKDVTLINCTFTGNCEGARVQIDIGNAGQKSQLATGYRNEDIWIMRNRFAGRNTSGQTLSINRMIELSHSSAQVNKNIVIEGNQIAPCYNTTSGSEGITMLFETAPLRTSGLYIRNNEFLGDSHGQTSGLVLQAGAGYFQGVAIENNYFGPGTDCDGTRFAGGFYRCLMVGENFGTNITGGTTVSTNYATRHGIKITGNMMHPKFVSGLANVTAAPNCHYFAAGPAADMAISGNVMTSPVYGSTFTTLSFATDDIITMTGSGSTAGMMRGDLIRVSNSGGALPAGMAAATTYYVREILSTTTFTVSASDNGAVLAITGAGTGTHTWVNYHPGITLGYNVYYAISEIQNLHCTGNTLLCQHDTQIASSNIYGMLLAAKALETGTIPGWFEITGNKVAEVGAGSVDVGIVEYAGGVVVSPTVGGHYSGNVSGGTVTNNNLLQGHPLWADDAFFGQFSSIELTNGTTAATDTTLLRASAGDVSVEGNVIYRAGGTDVPVTDGGTGRSTSTTAYGLLAAGTTATGAQQTLAAGATTEILVGGGASALPVWTTATGTGAPARAGSPTFTGTLGAAAITATGVLTLGSGPTTVSDSAGKVLSAALNTVAVANGGTGLTAGTSGGVLAYTANGTLASSGTLAANAIVVGGGAGVVPSTITTGTGIITALGVNTGSAGAPVLFNGAGGTPSSINLANGTSLPNSALTAAERSGTIGATWSGSDCASGTKAKGFFVCKYAATITGYSIVADAGTCTVKTWKIASGTAKPTSANSISTAGVSLSSGTAIESSTTSDFTTTTVTAGDIFCFELTTVATATEVTFQIDLQK